MDEDAGALPKKADFSEWFNELLWRAEIMDVRYPVKGLYVWFPYGFAIRKFVYQLLRELLDRDHKETLFPLLIPEQEFMKEAEHIKGFENEVYWVTHGGTTPLDVKLALRPTSETAIYPMFALWVRSHADLPIKIYQVVNTFRYRNQADPAADPSPRDHLVHGIAHRPRELGRGRSTGGIRDRAHPRILPEPLHPDHHLETPRLGQVSRG